ncbi:MDR family oxidoreductase [Galbitalea sp. SE-J8]|uniref:MDR family oxidoreductase n=1 Tax=Galbitalea sp. SE-J8 TaxID=3054952 RepID=UPI00259C9A60|nr:MDR family oxidoreductase [Galbitalea sp. SE-J8]MDM4763329.1 MDR family oxidoreductase [Galbitalea sp. SE-J8]
MSWRAWIVPEKGAPAALAERTDAELAPGDVTIDVTHSSVNFKDGLALAGRPGVVRSFPLVAGIDLVGTVAATEPGVGAAGGTASVGDRVLVNGWGLGETRDGGLAERARVDADWLVPVPESLSNGQAAAIGTAGFTAMLAVLAVEERAAISGSAPDGGLPVLVTGAAGGVGSLAIALLARLGFRVTASTGRADAEGGYLSALGAATVIDRAELAQPGRPLRTPRFSAVIDSVGGVTLANALAQTEYDGVVAACGLAGGSDLPATVMPFILRGVSLVGINSVYCPEPRRRAAWQRLATDLEPALLDRITATVPLDEAGAVAQRILAGGVRGRTVVAIAG